MRTNNKFADIENLRPSKKHPYKAIVAGILAGSLVAAMLFLGSCANMKSMEQIYPQSVVQMLEENGYTSQDYDAKKQEFLNADPGNLDCGLQIVPHNYYKERFGLTDQEISERVFGAEVFLVDGSLYLAARYIPTFEDLGWLKEGEDINKNRNVESATDNGSSSIGTLFKYDLDSETYDALKSAKSTVDVIANSKSIDKTKYYDASSDFGILKGDDMRIIREDYDNNFQYRYILNYILSTYTPDVIGEGAYSMYGYYWGDKDNKDQNIQIMDPYMYSSYPMVKDGVLSGYFIGRYKNDSKHENYLFKVGMTLNDEDIDNLNSDDVQKILGVYFGLHYQLNRGTKNGRTYILEIGKCDNKLNDCSWQISKAQAIYDFYKHGGYKDWWEDYKQKNN